MTKTVSIEGMHCPKCVAKVKNALEALEGVSSAEVSLEENRAVVTLTADVPDEAMRSAVEEKGFDVTGIA